MIEAISKGCVGTYADGSVKYTFIVEPKHAADAAKLFGMPGACVVVAALTQSASQKAAQDAIIAQASPIIETIAADKPKRGLLSQWAAMRCADLLFVEFLRPIYDKAMGGDGSGWGDVTADNDFGGDSSLWARHAILLLCDIQSRSELDTNKFAITRFDTLIRLPYSEWIKNNHE